MKTEDLYQIRNVLAQNLKQTKAKSKALIAKQEHDIKSIPDTHYYDGMAKGYGDAIRLIDKSLKSIRDSEVKNFYPVVSIGKWHLADEKIEGDTVKYTMTLCGVFLTDVFCYSPVTKENALMNEYICLNCRRSALKS